MLNKFIMYIVLFLAILLLMTSNTLFGQKHSKEVKTNIICEMKDEWLISRNLPIAQKYPVPTNLSEVENEFEVDPSIFDNYPSGQELSYTYFVTVDIAGKVKNIDFLVLANGFIEDSLKKSIAKIQFEPALWNNKPISSYIIVEYKLTCNECN